MTSPNDPSGPDNPRNSPPVRPSDPSIPFESAPEPPPGPDRPGTDSSSQLLDPEPLAATILSYNSSPNAEPPDPAAANSEIVPPGPTFTGRHSNRFLDPDLRVPWGWLDLLLLVFVYLGATAISTILLAIVFASQGVQWTTIQHSPRSLGFFVVADQILIYIALFAYLWTQARVRFNAPFWRTLGWRRLETTRWPRPIAYLGLMAFGFALSASVQLLSAAFPPKTKLPIENFLQNRQAALALLAMSIVLAPVVEETIFRGYLYPVAARGFGVPAGIIVTGTVFGLLHAEQLWGGWAQIALLVVVGIVFTWVRAAKRTVLASYLLHVSYNFLIVLGGLRSLRP
jgi:membrane protease YdiL (CAAX protease family)